MGKFIHSYMCVDTFIIDTTILTQVERVKSAFIVPVPDSATTLNLCIVDSKMLLENRDYYINNYEYMVVILLEMHKHLEKELLTQGIKFILHHIFLDIELLNILQLINKTQDLSLNNIILETIYDSAHNSIVLTDVKGQIIYANNYFINLTGYEFESLEGNMPRLIKSGFHEPEFYEQLWKEISSGETWHGFFVNKRKNGTLFYEEATISPIVNPQGIITNYLKIGKSVAKERLHQNALDSEWRSAKDALTHMLPRRTKTKDLSFDLRFRAFNHLGGDFIFYKEIIDGHYVIALLDVMGHGVASSFVGLQAVTQLDTRLEFESLLTSVQHINTYLSLKNSSGEQSLRYMSGIFIELDFNTQKFGYISAGHPEFYLISQENTLHAYESNNLLIGINAKYPFRQSVLDLRDIRHIFMYSDGILEADRSNIDKGDEVMHKVLNDALTGNLNILKHVLDRLLNPNFQEDDISMCLISFGDFP